MDRRRLLVIPILLAAALAAAPTAAAAGPVVIGPDHEEGLAPLADCGSFEILDAYSIDATMRLFLGADGDPAWAIETVSGVDTLTNSVTGKAIAAPFHNSVRIDFATGLGAFGGIIFRVTLPGAGVIFLDAGRLVASQDGSIVTFRAGPHQFIDGDFDALCAALA
jgi:hypothetical protein